MQNCCVSQVGRIFPQSVVCYPDKKWGTFREGDVSVTKAVSYGMPRIHPQILDTTFYLYPSRLQAKRGDGFGGTGFLVGVEVPIENRPEKGTAYYGVTNWHVAVIGGNSVARLRRKDGSVRIVKTDPSDWVFDPNGNDIAVIPFPLDVNSDKAAYLSQDLFVEEGEDIGIGEDVFMVGRFIDFDGGERNAPAVRFGQISMLPEKIKTEHGTRLSFCIDMHSRTGYSGSPVFVYRTHGSDLTSGVINIGPAYIKLLGIHWSQFPELWQISNKSGITGDSSLITDGRYIRGLSGMTCVAPAWDIMKLLNDKKFVQERAEFARHFSEEFKDKPLPPVEESASGDEASEVRDKTLERMLNTPPKKDDKKPAR